MIDECHPGVLDQVIPGSLFHGIHSDFFVPLGRHQEHGDLVQEMLHFIEKLNTVHIPETVIKDQYLRFFRVQDPDTLLPRFSLKINGIRQVLLE